MALPTNGEILYNDLRAQLLAYKNADAETKQRILGDAIAKLNSLGENIQEHQAVQAFTELSYAATLVNYANALHKIHNADWFDIMVDFKMPDVFKEPAFASLNDYFEFHPSAPQMRLKIGVNDVPKDIWKLFRSAQQEKLARTNKTHLFNLNELDIDNLPHDQLYPLPIQMLGQYDNEAVDRVWGSQQGEYSFAFNFGVYLLPGGGMVEINKEATLNKILKKMLDEHLEEQHGNLWFKAASDYDALEPEVFHNTLNTCIASKLKSHPKWKEKLKTFQIGGTNSEVLANVIHEIDVRIELIKSQLNGVNDSGEISVLENDKQALNELRASVQVETFKLSSLYNEAVQFAQDNSELGKIEQFGDTRACGGKQTSNTFFMFEKDLACFFNQRFGGAPIELADDIRGSKLKSLTLLQALENFSKVKFSHILCVLTHQVESLQRNHMRFDAVWDNAQFLKAKTMICSGAQEIAAKVSVTSQGVKLDAEAYSSHGLFGAAVTAVNNTNNKEPQPSPVIAHR